MHGIAGKAVAFGEALKPEFREYTTKVIKNAQSLSNSLISRGFNIISGGTETHIVLVDIRNKNLKGNSSAKKLEEAGIVCNKNGIPFDTESPFVTSGLRFGSPAETTRGMGEKEFHYIGQLIADVLENKVSTDEIKSKVKELTSQFEFYV
jgi:glycine hydroxymethyltransferase